VLRSGDSGGEEGNGMRFAERSLKLEEHAASGLFSEMNPVIICLAVQAVSFALSLGTVSEPRTTTGRLIGHKCSLVIVLFFGCLLQIMRERWQIPQNNLLWIEAILVLVFVLIGTKHHTGLAATWGNITLGALMGGNSDAGNDDQSLEAEEEQRAFQKEIVQTGRNLISPGITTPMLGVAVLAQGGESDASALLLSYVGMCCVSVLWVIEHRMLSAGVPGSSRFTNGVRSLGNRRTGLGGGGAGACNTPRSDASETAQTTVCTEGGKGESANAFLLDIAWVTRLNAWLCLTPVLLRLSMRLDAIAHLPGGIQAPAGWIVATLVIVLCWLILTTIGLTLASDPRYQTIDGYGMLSAAETPINAHWFPPGFAFVYYTLYWAILLMVPICSLVELGSD
jgi:hypothetical protein